jgi:hypothetical protein
MHTKIAHTAASCHHLVLLVTDVHVAHDPPIGHITAGQPGDLSAGHLVTWRFLGQRQRFVHVPF